MKRELISFVDLERGLIYLRFEGGQSQLPTFGLLEKHVAGEWQFP